MSQGLRQAGLDTTTLELLDPNPYPKGVKELEPLRLALQTLYATSEGILQRYGFTKDDVTSIQLSATPAPWNKDGSILHTRAVITATNGRTFDSGWLGEGAA
jgi:hypothetical protein